MTGQPTPRDGKNAEQAEQRLKRLHARFAKVSRGMVSRGMVSRGIAGRRAQAGKAGKGGNSSPGGMPLTPFEFLILFGAAVFVLFAIVVLVGG